MQVGTFWTLDVFSISQHDLGHYDIVGNNIYYIEYAWLKNKFILENGHAAYARLFKGVNGCNDKNRVCFIIQGKNLVFLHTRDGLDIKVDIKYKPNITSKEKKQVKDLFDNIVRTIEYRSVL